MDIIKKCIGILILLLPLPMAIGATIHFCMLGSFLSGFIFALCYELVLGFVGGGLMLGIHLIKKED